MHLTPLGTEFESVIAATVMFLAGGALSFVCCFCITHGYIWHKKRIYRNRLRHEWSEGTDSTGTDILPPSLSQQQRSQSKQFAIDQQQQHLKRVVVVEVPSRKMAAAPQGAKRVENGDDEKKKTTTPSMMRPSHQKEQQQQRRTNVAFDCGSTGTEETNSS